MSALVLMYHRIADVLADPWGLCVTPAHFAEQLDVLRRVAKPVGLSELTDQLTRGSLRDRAVAVTFDDGYADNLLEALPALERYDVSATEFVATGQTGRDEPFWWDELDRLFLLPGTLPRQLTIVIAGETCEFDLGEFATYHADAARVHRNWRAFTTLPTTRHSTYLAIWQRLQPRPHAEQAAAMSMLRTWSGVALRTERPDAMSAAEVAQLASAPLIDIGAHTVTHPMLATLSEAEQRSEIAQSKQRLEDIVGRELRSFSYPYGSASPATVDMVRAAGFARACRTQPAPVRADTDPLQLPRMQPEDWGGDVFAEKLEEWFA